MAKLFKIYGTCFKNENLYLKLLLIAHILLLIAHMLVSLDHDYTCHAPTKYPPPFPSSQGLALSVLGS